MFNPPRWEVTAKHGVYPLLAAGWPVTFVATKVTKKASAERLLCRTGLCPANRAEPRTAIILPHFVCANPTLQQKLAMSLQPHYPPLFCPLSPEAYLLTEKKKKLD